MKMRRILALALVLALSLSALTLVKADVVYARAMKMNKAKVTIVKKYGAANTVQLSVTTVPPLETLGQKITWESATPRVAVVDQNGLVTAKEKGKCRIWAKAQGESKELKVMCAVTVQAVSVKEVRLSDTKDIIMDPSVASENSAHLTATVIPANASERDVVWTSSDPAVATVDGGEIKAVGSGKCTVTASCGGQSASVNIISRDKSQMMEITLSAGGDIVLGGDRELKTDERFDKIFQANGPSYTLKLLKKVFKKDDFTILNLEGPLYTRAHPRIPAGKRQYNMGGKPEYVDILTEGSVEVANVVNNHISDYNTKPETKDLLVSKGIKLSDDDLRSANNYIEITRNGKTVRVGFLAFLTPLRPDSVKSKVHRMKVGEAGGGKGPGCDIIIVSFHFGDIQEHTYPVRGIQKMYGHMAVNGGADLVLGHHTHVPSGIETYKGVYIYYGLGAVESSGPNFKYLNFIMQQTLMVDPVSGYCEGQVPTIYPICPSSAAPSEPNNCQPMLLEPSDPRYAQVFAIIDRTSKKGGLNPAPYEKGVPPT